jgi:hypothetical protein
MASRVPDVDRSASIGVEVFLLHTHAGRERVRATVARVVTRPRRPHVRRAPARPGDAAGESSYVELGLRLVSPDEKLLAYSVDTTGRRGLLAALR